MYTQCHSRITGVGGYAPEIKVTSREILSFIRSEERFGISTDWLDRVMGVKERRASPEGWMPSDLAVPAARQALDDAKILPEQVDAIIYAGAIRDYIEPATAHVVQEKLGAHNAIAFDVSNACMGFMNAIHLMDSLIAAGQVKCGLIVTGEQGFRNTANAYKVLQNTEDREVFMKLAAGLTLGDAGAAMVMEPKADPTTGLLGISVQSEGRHFRLCMAGNRENETVLETDMPQIVAETARLVKSTYTDILSRLGWTSNDIECYVPHQVGRKGLKIHMAITRIPASKIPNSVETMGNIITATIPYVLHMQKTAGRLRAGEKIFLSGTGSGICVSQAGLIWGSP